MLRFKGGLWRGGLLLLLATGIVAGPGLAGDALVDAWADKFCLYNLH